MCETLLAAKEARYVAYTMSDGKVSWDCGDDAARVLRGLSVEAAMFAADRIKRKEPGYHAAKYAHLNPGQKRMNAGNIIRAAYRKIFK
jgi:hypothetical protein